MGIEALSNEQALDALNDVSEEAPIDLVEDEAKDTIVDEDEDEESEAGDKDKDSEVDESTSEEDSGEEDSSDSDADDDADPDGATDEVDEDGDKAKQDKEPAIEPPASLDEKQREEFKKLPRDAQQLVADHDRALVADHTRKTQDIAASRKVLDARLKALETVVSEKQARMDKWAKVDWVQQARELSAEDYNYNWAKFQEEKREFEGLQAEQKKQADADYADHVNKAREDLRRLAPDLAGDSKEASQRREEIMNAAIADGYTRDDLAWMSAREMVIYRDALAWRKYQAEKAKKTTITVKKNEKSKGRTIKPSSRTAAPTGTKGVVTKRFESKPSQHNAMALLNNMDDD